MGGVDVISISAASDALRRAMSSSLMSCTLDPSPASWISKSPTQGITFVSLVPDNSVRFKVIGSDTVWAGPKLKLDEGADLDVDGSTAFSGVFSEKETH